MRGRLSFHPELAFGVGAGEPRWGSAVNAKSRYEPKSVAAYANVAGARLELATFGL